MGACDNANVYPDGFAAPEGFKFPAWSTFGPRSKFGAGSTFGARSTFGAWSTFGARSTFGAWSTFGAESTFGARSTFGAWSRFGAESTFGAGSKFGDNCVIEGVVASRIMTLANVDGSGRQILLIWHTGGVLVRAGCFLGTPGEFVRRALEEDKLIYAAVIPAVVAAVEGVK